MVHFPTQAKSLENLTHHHVSMSLPDLTPAQLAYFGFSAPPDEVRLHIWNQDAEFPATALRFCTHMNYERTVSYSSPAGVIPHTPEHIKTGQPCTRACGGPPIRFIVELNRAVWEVLQVRVTGLTALRKNVVLRIQQILKEGTEIELAEAAKVAKVAEVAEIAEVAEVAEIAEVAEVANVVEVLEVLRYTPSLALEAHVDEMLEDTQEEDNPTRLTFIRLQRVSKL